MYLKSLYLRNFRNYEEQEVSFSQTQNVFFGKNAQGKTNLLEAIYLIATGKSFRTQNFSDLIYLNKSFFFIEALIETEGVEQSIKLFFDGQKKTLEIGKKKSLSYQPLLGILPMVLYTPYDLDLIAGAPSERRRFLNLHLAQSDPLYVYHLTRFWRAMKQRNALLKMKKQETLSYFEEEMDISQKYLKEKREKMVRDLQEIFKQKKELFSFNQEEYDLQLQLSAAKDYRKQLEKNRVKEMEIGSTLSGPHRDDLLFTLNDKPLRLFASEGQKKTAITALKLSEWQRLQEESKDQPLLGFDDLEGALDASRKVLFQSFFSKLGQVFLTTTEPFENTFQNAHGILVENGTVKNCLEKSAF